MAFMLSRYTQILKTISDKFALVEDIEMTEEENINPSDHAQNRGFSVELPDSYDTYVDRWAIMIGVSKYKHESLNLKYADRDAEEFYKLMLSPIGGNFKPDHIVKLINHEATTANVTKALRSFLKKPGREDLVIIYFACHGSPDFDRPGNVYLLTHDTDPNDIAGTALPMREIDLSLRENLLSERVVILADTCHSAAIGGGIGRRGTTNSTALVNRYLKEVSTTRGGIALLTSAEAAEVSFEDARWGGGHGVFTHYLLRGMQGEADLNQNGFVTIGELFEYVRAKVQEDTEYRQHPSIGTNPYDRELPLAITFPNNENTETSPEPRNFLQENKNNFKQRNITAKEKNRRITPHKIGIAALIVTLVVSGGLIGGLAGKFVNKNNQETLLIGTTSNKTLDINPILSNATNILPIENSKMLFLGNASNDEAVYLDTQSISFDDEISVRAVYYLGKAKHLATINCSETFWTVEGDKTKYKPMTQASKNLIALACDIKKVKDKNEGIGYFIVYDPPANLRSTPNGSIICKIDTMQLIKPHGDPQNDWYSTDAICPDGNQKKGLIHKTQLKPLL